jgi:hypothetical protein
MPKEPDKLARKRLNAAEKRALAAGRVGRFVQQYGRKAHNGHDPNDRSYDRKVESGRETHEAQQVGRTPVG